MFFNDKPGGNICNLPKVTRIYLKGQKRATGPSNIPGASSEIWFVHHGLVVYSCFILGIRIISTGLDYGLDSPSLIPYRAIQ
jgi:hypothetical protein